MDQKTNKVYLPSTYEQFLQQKKKTTKPVVHPKQIIPTHDYLKENKGFNSH